MSQTIGEYAQQKAMIETIQAGRTEIMKSIEVAIAAGFPMEFSVKMFKDNSAPAVESGELTEESVFLVECWIREAYEKADKEKNDE